MFEDKEAERKDMIILRKGGKDERSLISSTYVLKRVRQTGSIEFRREQDIGRPDSSGVGSAIAL